MNTEEVVNEWKKGCSCSINDYPGHCVDCTDAMVDIVVKKSKWSTDKPTEVGDYLWKEIGIESNSLSQTCTIYSEQLISCSALVVHFHGQPNLQEDFLLQTCADRLWFRIPT